MVKDIGVQGQGLVVKGLEMVQILTNFYQNTSPHIIERIDEWHKKHTLFKINNKNDFILGWYLKYILIVAKKMTMTMLQYEEAIVIKAQQFDVFYS